MAPARTAAGSVVLGVALLGGVVTWKLSGSTYTGDVTTICEAEARSGSLLGKDMSAVTQWVRAHLTTADGNRFFSSLRDAEIGARAERLRGEASTLRIGSCPMVRSYERLAAEAEYRGDLQRLCSAATFPDLAELDDGARLSRVEDWIDGQAASPRAKQLGGTLRRMPPEERAGVLRAAARQIDVYSCGLAKVLDLPPPPAPE
jgi:hypothetical protein